MMGKVSSINKKEKTIDLSKKIGKVTDEIRVFISTNEKTKDNVELLKGMIGMGTKIICDDYLNKKEITENFRSELFNFLNTILLSSYGLLEKKEG